MARYTKIKCIGRDDYEKPRLFCSINNRILLKTLTDIESAIVSYTKAQEAVKTGYDLLYISG